jgi:alpha-ribazole phosphatase
MLEIYLVRHTSVGVSKSVCYGKSDVALSENFIYEKAEVCEKLHKAGAFSQTINTHFYSSPLQRCASLAEYIKAQKNPHINIAFDKRVQEMDFGDWEMQKWEALPIDSFQAWMNAFTSMSVPNGESFEMLYNRTKSFLNHLVEKHENPDSLQSETIFVFAHAGSIRTMLSYCLGMPTENTFRFGMEYGAVSRLRYLQGYWKVDFVNR